VNGMFLGCIRGKPKDNHGGAENTEVRGMLVVDKAAA
jgi:hypothetical protein